MRRTGVLYPFRPELLESGSHSALAPGRVGSNNAITASYPCLEFSLIQPSYCNHPAPPSGALGARHLSLHDFEP